MFMKQVSSSRELRSVEGKFTNSRSVGSKPSNRIPLLEFVVKTDP